jgi:hypothetical protein
MVRFLLQILVLVLLVVVPLLVLLLVLLLLILIGRGRGWSIEGDMVHFTFMNEAMKGVAVVTTDASLSDVHPSLYFVIMDVVGFKPQSC